MDHWSRWLLVGAVVVLPVVGRLWCDRRWRTVLERWASRDGYRILAAEHRTFFRGPFSWSTSVFQTVYRVTVVGGRGTPWKVWVRCGEPHFRLLSDRVEVRWDHAPAVAARGPDSSNPMYDRWLDG